MISTLSPARQAAFFVVCTGLFCLAGRTNALPVTEQAAAQAWASQAFAGVQKPGAETTRFLSALPFSFVLGGQPSSALLPRWHRQIQTLPAQDGRQVSVIQYDDPVTKLALRCDLTKFSDAPAIEWVLHFTNNGSADTPILEHILPLDLRVQPPVGEVTLHHLNGSNASENDYLPHDDALALGGAIGLAPVNGRSSDSTLPFWNLQWPGGGVMTAVGWSGQWSANIAHDADGGLTMTAGQETSHFLLHPGETVRTPRILLLPWQGGVYLHGNNLLRRTLLAHYTPRIGGQITLPPVSNSIPIDFNKISEQNAVTSIAAVFPSAETFWIDAGWFVGGWPGGVGNWIPDPPRFPNGLKPVGAAVHAKRMRFILWFEPERVSNGSRIAREHPEWVLHTDGGDGLFNYGDPNGLKWMTDMLSQSVTDYGVDVFRNDFNIDPLRFWRAADTPDRQGITEIRYIEGFYALWDELRRRHPGLTIDNCASGGRRIDLETISRSYPLWRSDTVGAPGAGPAWDQAETAGLSLYVPLHSTGTFSAVPYNFRSAATTGIVFNLDPGTPGFPRALAEHGIAELKSLRPLWLGDYYPLAPINTDQKQWCAWQLDRPELGQGFALFFRRAQCPGGKAAFLLHGLDAKAHYRVYFADTKEQRDLTGAELALGLDVSVGAQPGSALVEYRRLGEVGGK